MMVTPEAGRLSDVSGTANGMMCVPSHGPGAVPSSGHEGRREMGRAARWSRSSPFSPKEGSSGGVGW
jgi:hypothetical protein